MSLQLDSMYRLACDDTFVTMLFRLQLPSIRPEGNGLGGIVKDRAKAKRHFDIHMKLVDAIGLYRL